MAIELWTSPTPNGWKVSIMIEELIEAGIDVGPVEVRTINLMKGDQFEDDFTERNPNQKIPTLRHGDRDVIESCAILQYLGEKFPSPLLPLDERKWDVLPWVYWQAANVGPVFGNKLSYTRYMDDVPDIKKSIRLSGSTTKRCGWCVCWMASSVTIPGYAAMNSLLPTSRFIHGYGVEVEQGEHHQPTCCHGMGRPRPCAAGC